MGRGLQPQGRSRLETNGASDIDETTTTPAMQALIDASTAASEVQTEEAASAESTSTNGDKGGDTSSDSTTTDSDPTRPGETGQDSQTDDEPTQDTTTDGLFESKGTLSKLDPSDHARVSDPIVRPAKKHSFVHPSSNGNGNGNKNGNGNGKHPAKNHTNGNATATADSGSTKDAIGFSESILSRLFEPDRKQKPELWDFVRLVAPGPADQPPQGQYKWRSKDAVAAYCLKCKIAFTYTPGTSKTVSRHLIAYHELKASGSGASHTKKAVGRKGAKASLSQTGGVADASKHPSLSEAPSLSAENTSIRIRIPTKDSLSSGKRRRPSYTIQAAERNENDPRDSKGRADPTPPAVTDDGGRNNESTVCARPSSPLKKRKLPRSATEPASTKKGRRHREHHNGTPRRDDARSPTEVEPEADANRKDKELVDLFTADEDEDGEDAFLKSHIRNRKATTTKALFRWWAGSYQYLYCQGRMLADRSTSRRMLGTATNATSLFVSFCKTLDDSFEMPELSVMDSLASSSYERIRSEIQIHASKLFPGDNGSVPNTSQNHEFVFASVRRIKVVRITGPRIGADTAVGEGCIRSTAGRMENETNRHPVTRGTGNERGTKAKNSVGGQPVLAGRNGTPRGYEIEAKLVYPVRLTFCTPMFRMKSYVIAVIPEETEKCHGDNGNTENRSSNNNSATNSPYSTAVDRALQMYGFPRDNVSRVVVRGSSETVKSGLPTSTTANEYHCILERLDEVFVKALRSKAILPLAIREVLEGNGAPQNGKTNGPQEKPISSMFCTVRAYEKLLSTLLACSPPSQSNETAPSNTITSVLDTITPLRDAIQTLSEDSYSTVGLTIPVLRRVQELLHQLQTKQLKHSGSLTTAWLEEGGCEDEYESSATTKPVSTGRNGDAGDNGSVDDAPKESLESFHRSILLYFEKEFASVLNENPDLMWTIPLDPRLIAMRGLSETEQNKAKSVLIEEVAKVVEIIDDKETNQRHELAPNGTKRSTPEDYRTRYSSASTMGGIFWGDDLDASTTSTANSNQPASFIGRNARDYAAKNVESYFNTVHSQRHIREPMLWWKNNQDQFPELAMLARKWMSASAVYGRKNTRDNESERVIQTSYSDTESVCRMIFLHDNNDLL